MKLIRNQKTVADYDGPELVLQQAHHYWTLPRENQQMTRYFALPADFLRVAQDVFCEEDLREEDS